MPFSYSKTRTHRNEILLMHQHTEPSEHTRLTSRRPTGEHYLIIHMAKRSNTRMVLLGYFYILISDSNILSSRWLVIFKQMKNNVCPLDGNGFSLQIISALNHLVDFILTGLHQNCKRRHPVLSANSLVCFIFICSKNYRHFKDLLSLIFNWRNM